MNRQPKVRMDEPGEARGGRRPFAAFIQEQGRGRLHNELSEDLAELNRAVIETGKKGSLTLKVDVAMGKDGTTVLVADTVTLKLPKHESKPSIFFFDEHGNLSRENPRQPELPLRVAPGGKSDQAADAVAGEVAG